MSEAKQAWNVVGERFSSWGTRLSARYKEAAPGDEDAKETQRKIEEAAREIGEQLTRAFNALGDTLRDEDAKRDLREAVGSIGDAIAATVNEAGDAVRRRTGSNEADTGAPPAPRPDANAEEPPPTEAP
jgi:hypothetical protein